MNSTLTVNAACKHIHDALNDIYADTLDLADLEPLFTDIIFAAFKTQPVHGVNVVRLLSDIVYNRIAAVATPGSKNSDRIGELLRECSLSFVDQMYGFSKDFSHYFSFESTAQSNPLQRL